MASEIKINAPSYVHLFYSEFDESSVSDQIEKLLFFFFSTFMLVGALVWGVLCLFYGMRMPSLIPFGYVLLTLFNFLICGSSKTTSSFGCSLQIGASIVLPFVFQHTLGGIAASGMVMIWSILALVGSLIIQNKRMTYVWLGLFIALSLVSFYLESSLPDDSVFRMPLILTSLNIIMVSVMVYGLGHYFATMQTKLRNRLRNQKIDLKENQNNFDKELETAKSFQDVLLRNNSLKVSGYKNFNVNIATSKISGNFSWMGGSGDVKVTVIFDNPSSGIRGSLESMFLWSLMDRAVFQLRKKSPLELIEYLQSEISTKYNFEEIKEGMSHVGLLVLCHDTITNQLSYATMDTTVLMGTASSSRVLSGFKESYPETVLSKLGNKLVTGSVGVEPGMRIVVINDSMLESKGLSMDTELLSAECGFVYLMNTEMSLAEKKLRREVDKFSSNQDVFIQWLEL